ncbi:hypothetical protein RB195_024976 [Necator americanus]|uniref:Uncharacterized protein n=1 Tax=Necator americanus TaxID=51031 RepID=A0ABR1EQE4_NECAM
MSAGRLNMIVSKLGRSAAKTTRNINAVEVRGAPPNLLKAIIKDDQLKTTREVAHELVIDYSIVVLHLELER